MANRFKHTNFLFWQRWLFFSSILFAATAILFAFFGNSFLFEAYNKLLAGVFWGNSEFPENVESFYAFIHGSFGGTMACCYILLAFIAYHPFKEKQVWARNAIIIAFSFWVLIDSSMCFYFGVYPQIYIINTFSIVVKALPLIFTWKEFSKAGKARL